MSTEALSVGQVPAPTDPGMAVAAAQGSSSDHCDQTEHQDQKHPGPAFLHSPPDSNNAAKSEQSDSELSDLDEEPVLPDTSELPSQEKAQDEATQPSADSQPQEEPEEDIGEVLPDHWSGNVAVFKPTMHQFKDFQKFMDKVNSYGMKSGIIKIIPPQEWKDKQPPLDDMVKHVRVREPIKQEIMGNNGTYRQVNVLHGRSYNVPQWRQLCEQSEHQPPARRGERRANAEKPKPRRPAAPKTTESSTPKKRGKAKGKRGRGRPSKKSQEEDERPMTPVSPKPEASEVKEEVVDSVEQDPGAEVDPDEQPAAPRRMGGARPAKSSKTQSVSARRKFSKREGSAMIDEAAFKDFDYRMDLTDYTPERCEELERAYWKTLTYAAPLYGADMMGTLFDERTESWNLNKLPNILDVLGTKIPGVNTAYLYFGMWKATFAWHLEDVDLYSINYVHFGAPKQWYSISQADARRFEAAMKNIWPADAKACNQFLRHKGFLISPQHLLQHYNIKVNKVVSYPGEFVVTFPYGYHSGYNLGYNCAEAVNFALEPWLEMGKIAKRCECAQAQDSVWINVYEIERKLRGEETEYEETEDEDEEEDDDDDEGPSGLPTPPASHGVKVKIASRKRKRAAGDKGAKPKVKKIKLRLKTKAEPPCCLCPNEVASMDLLPTDDGRKAHRVCALYLPETYIDLVDGKEIISNISGIHKDRTGLKCLYCRSKRGACFQCSQKKCARAYHATCAAAAGVFVEEEEVPVFGEDQTEYKEQAFEFSCRFHRTKRDKKMDGASLEVDERIFQHAKALKKDETAQFQYHKGDIFAGVVVENRTDEEMVLIDVLPSGGRLEVEWKWLLLADPADYHLPKASANAIPMPASRKAKDKLNAKRPEDEKPRKGDHFTDGCTWAEFNLHEVDRNRDQVKVDLAKEDQIWHYLGRTSTEAKAQYTEDPAKRRHNPKGNYLDTLPKPAKPPKPPKPASAKRQSYTIPGPQAHPYPQTTAPASQGGKVEKPYVYKPRIPASNGTDPSASFTTQMFVPPTSAAPNYYNNYYNYGTTPTNSHGNLKFSMHRFEVKPQQNKAPYQNNAPKQVNWHNQTVVHQPPAQVHQTQQGHAPSQVQASVPPTSAAQTPPQGQSRQPTKFSWQVHPTIYHKYSFFQVHHNRDSTKYRTPYSLWGGFTNGYEGDLRAHLMAHPNDLMRRSSMTSGSPPGTLAQPVVPSPATQQSFDRPGSSTSSTIPPSPQVAAGTQNAQQHYAPSPVSTGQIAPQVASDANGQNTQPKAASKAKTSPVPKSFKKPAKESPVPLPAGFLAAMKPSPSASPTTTRPPASHILSQQHNQPTVSDKPATPAPSTPTLGNATKDTTGLNGSPGQTNGIKSSKTPVPIPKFPGMTPHQAAARFLVSEYASSAPSSVIPQIRDPRALAAYERLTKQRDPRSAAEATNSVGLGVMNASSQELHGRSMSPVTQEFPDVPGSESMEFMEKMMANLRRVGSQS